MYESILKKMTLPKLPKRTIQDLIQRLIQTVKNNHCIEFEMGI